MASTVTVPRCNVREADLNGTNEALAQHKERDLAERAQRFLARAHSALEAYTQGDTDNVGVTTITKQLMQDGQVLHMRLDREDTTASPTARPVPSMTLFQKARLFLAEELDRVRASEQKQHHWARVEAAVHRAIEDEFQVRLQSSPALKALQDSLDPRLELRAESCDIRTSGATLMDGGTFQIGDIYLSVVLRERV